MGNGSAKLLAIGLITATGALAGPAARQVTTGPVAVYWMSASTTSGIGAMAAAMGGGGGQRPSIGAMMAMGAGGFNPNAANKSLLLQLGSSRRPQGDPAAEHDPPDGLGLGPMLPLLTPLPVAASAPAAPQEPATPPQFRQPHGKMLIFWGCGEHAGAGQPLVIDFATLGQGAGMQQMAGLMRGLALTPEQPPSVSRNATYGEWPNRETRDRLTAGASLVGAHTVKGNYSPDINFSLAANQDFLAPFQMTANQINPTSSATLGWISIDGALGYFATMMGVQNQDQIVLWSSSAAQTATFAAPQYLSNGDVARLVAAQTLMPPSQTSCIIPEEAVAAAGSHGFFNLVAYGGEANMSYPPRPPAPAPWNIAWEVKVRYRSATSGIVGQNLGGPRGQQQPGQPPPPKRKPNPAAALMRGLGGVIP